MRPKVNYTITHMWKGEKLNYCPLNKKTANSKSIYGMVKLAKKEENQLIR